MAKYIAVTNIKHNGHFIEAGSEVLTKDFSKESWTALRDAGAVAEAVVSTTEVKTDAENQELKARIAELEAQLAEAGKKSADAPQAKPQAKP